MTREPDFFKNYTLKIFHVKKIRIGSYLMFQLDEQNLQVKFNSIQKPLSCPTSNMTKKVVA